MLELSDLQVFLVAAETENFSETGRILQISQPAVSGHIQALEQRLNTRLFDRTGRSIKLNEVGEALVPAVRRLLKEAQQIEEFVAQQRGTITGRLTLGCSTSAGKYLLPKLIARFMQRYPQTQIVCEVGPRGQALESLCEGKIDLAISSLRVPRRAIEYRYFADDQVVLIAPRDHPWAQAGKVRIEDLVEHPVIMREANSGTAITLNRALAAHDMSLDMLQIHLVLANTESIVQAVLEGIGPGFVSRIAAIPAIEKGQVIQVQIEHVRLIQRLFMARQTGIRASEVQRLFWDFAFAPENEEIRRLLT